MKHHELKITEIDGSLGVILPKEIVDNLELKKGDELYGLEASGGVFFAKKLSTHCKRIKCDLEKQLKIGRKFMEDHKEVLKKLAKHD